MLSRAAHSLNFDLTLNQILNVLHGFLFQSFHSGPKTPFSPLQFVVPDRLCMSQNVLIIGEEGLEVLYLNNVIY